MPVLTPKHVVTAASSFSRWQLARQYPGTYSLTLQRGDWLTRYVSAEPGVAIAEAWRHHLKDAAPNHWCLIDRHDEALFFMQVRGDVVRQAKLLPLAELDTLTLSMCDAVYLTPAIDATDTMWSSYALQDVAALTQKEWQSYALKKTRAPALLTAGALVLMGLAASLWLIRSVNAPISTAPLVVDDYQSYRQAMSRSLSASKAVGQTMRLAALAQGAPPGWSVSALTLQSQQLTARLKRDEEGRLADARHWRETLPHVAAVLTPQSLTLTAELTHTLAAWTTQMRAFGDHHSLLDTLTKLGWHLSETQEDSHTSPSDRVQTLSVTLEKDAMTLSELATLETLFQAYPLTITALQMTPSAAGTYHTTLHLTYTGEKA